MGAAEINRFLNAVRPTGRGYLLTLNGKQVNQLPFASNKEAEGLVSQAIARHEDVFVSLAQFQEGSTGRNGGSADSFASVWIDIDCGDGKPHETQPEGMAALQRFLEKTSMLTPSILVNSGGGIHAYWCFTQIIGKAEWEPCAKALKAVCLGMGLEIDKQPTADAARVMRIPGSENLKLPNNPRPVFIIEPIADQDVTLIEFDTLMGKLSSLQATLPTSIPRPLDSITQSLISDPETPERIQTVQSALGCIDPDITYPDWFRVLCAIKNTDWRCAKALAREWSAMGEKFDVSGFEKQWGEITNHRGVTLGTLFHLAEASGWVRPQGAGGADQPGDIRNGKAYAAMHHGVLLFVKPMGRWFRWDGNRWAICLRGEEMEAAKESARQLLTEASKVAASDTDKGKRLFAHALQTQNLPRLEAMIRLASSESGMVIGRADELDSNPWLLGVQNGVVNLETGSLLVADPKMLITKQTNAQYLPDAGCPRWLEFLEEIFSGDLETIESVQRLLGYTLTGITTEEVMVICLGFGSNGKSVFSNVIGNIIGEYFTVGPNCLLVARDKTDNSVRNDLAKLFGARLISVNELAAGARLDEQVIKQLAGREPISARFLHKEFFDFMPTGKVWLRTNHRPIITGEDDGIWRRLILVPFKRKFSEAERDIHLESRLLEERDGILNWMVQGAAKWRKGGLFISPVIRAEVGAYRTESDLLGEFLEDKTFTASAERVEQSELFFIWKCWCEGNGLKPGSKAAFTRKLAERGYTETKSNGRRFYQGVRLVASIQGR